MQKKTSKKLLLSKETLRTLAQRNLEPVDGNGTTATSETSTPTLTCDSCWAWCSRNTAC